MIDTQSEYRCLNHLEVNAGSVACVVSTLQDIHHQYGYPALQILRKLVTKLGQVSFI